MEQHNFQYRLGSSGAMEIQADSEPKASYDEDGRSGWCFNRQGDEHDHAHKLGLKIFSGENENMQMKNIESISFVGSIDKWSLRDWQVPFFTVFTKKKNDGTDFSSEFHSSHSYMIHKDSQLIRKGEKCIFYCLDKPEVESQLRTVALKTRMDTGQYNGDNEVQSVSFQSSPWGNNFSVYVEKLSMDCSGFGRRVGKNSIKMKLLS